MFAFIGNAAKAVKEMVVGKDEKPSTSDLIFNIMYFLETSVPEIMKNVHDKNTFMARVLIPFNYLVVPLVLGARVYDSEKHGKNTLLFNEYHLTEKEITHIAYVFDKLETTVTKPFLTSLAGGNGNDPDDITNIPTDSGNEIKGLTKIPIKELQELVYGKNRNDGIVARRLTGTMIRGLAADGERISKAIQHRSNLVWGGAITTLVLLAVTGGLIYTRKNGNAESSTTEVVTTDGGTTTESGEVVTDAEYCETDSTSDEPYVAVEEGM